MYWHWSIKWPWHVEILLEGAVWVSRADSLEVSEFSLKRELIHQEHMMNYSPLRQWTRHHCAADEPKHLCEVCSQFQESAAFHTERREELILHMKCWQSASQSVLEPKQQTPAGRRQLIQMHFVFILHSMVTHPKRMNTDGSPECVGRRCSAARWWSGQMNSSVFSCGTVSVSVWGGRKFEMLIWEHPGWLLQTRLFSSVSIEIIPWITTLHSCYRYMNHDAAAARFLRQT